MERYLCPFASEGCELTVDIILKSSDGKLLGAHRQNLEMHTEGIPYPIHESTESTSVWGPVSLEETADVLRLILRYTHRMRQPNLNNVSFTLLASLADAVEKYKIYSAMEVCKLKMKDQMYLHEDRVFLFFAKHDYTSLADEAAMRTINNLPSEFLPLIRGAGGLHDDIAFRWLRFRDCWLQILIQSVLTEPTFHSILHKGGLESCSAWPPFQFSVIKDVSENLRNLDHFAHVVETHKSMLDSCAHCRLRSTRWASMVSDKVNSLPKYSEA